MKGDVFPVIADPTRLAILVLIAVQAMTPNAIAAHFTSSWQAIPKHIHVLLESAPMSQQQQGREIYYQLNPAKMQEADKWLQQSRDIIEKRFTQLDDVLAKLKPTEMNKAMLPDFLYQLIFAYFDTGLGFLW